MTPQLIELQERIIQAVNDRTVPDGLLAPGFVMRQDVTSATDYAYHGADGWHDWLEDVLEYFGRDAHCELIDILATGADYVVAALRIAGSSALSDGPLELHWYSVQHFRDGRLITAHGFASPQEALAAAGLEA